MNPNLSSGFDLERLKPLGSKADVQRQTQSVFGARIRVKLEIGDEEPVRQITLVLPSDPTSALGALRILCDRTGWRVFDRDAGRFLDLASARPLAKPMAAPPMFQWWIGLPSPIRVFVGLVVVFAIFYIYVLNWVLSWH
jgi:hypothetical protein